MKKLLVTLLTAAMTVGLLAGCGNDSGDSGDSGSGGASNGETQDITLKVWCPQNQIDTGAMDQMEKAFAEAHPEWNITWKNEVVGEDKCADELLKDVGNSADVFLFANDQLPKLVEAGAIAQLGGDTEKMVREEIAEAVTAIPSLCSMTRLFWTRPT